MDTADRDARFFGIFGLSLAVAGMLIPFIIAALDSGGEAAGGFFIFAELLALTFAIIGRKTLQGRVTIYITGAALVLILVLLLMKAG